MIEGWRDLASDEVLLPGDRVYSAHLGRWVTVGVDDWGAGLSQAGAWSAPQRRVSAAPQPLTDEQMRDLVPGWQSGWSFEGVCVWMGRAVERAHGICCDVDEKI